MSQRILLTAVLVAANLLAATAWWTFAQRSAELSLQLEGLVNRWDRLASLVGDGRVVSNRTAFSMSMLESLAARNGVDGNIASLSSIDERRVAVVLEDAELTALLSWLRDLALESGVGVQSFEFSVGDETSRAQISLEHD